jgi:adenylosuccinate synthase
MYLSKETKMIDTVVALVGGQYGSEGKGNVVSRMVQDWPFDTLVRSGGPNAGHTVWFGDRKIVYHHLPSGTLHSLQSRIVLAAGAVLRLSILQKEIATTECGDRLYIDPNAVVIEDDDIAAEADLIRAVGSTGQGVGVATANRVLRRARPASQVAQLEPYVFPAHKAMAGRVLLEGTQGSGLSLYHGPYPFVTSRDTNVGGLLAECGVSPRLVSRVVVVFRTFPIRVAGNSGPMVTECDWETVADMCGVDADVLRERERTTTTKRLRRVGLFDFNLSRDACRINGPTDLALTFADYLDAAPPDRLPTLIADMEAAAGVPVRWVANGPRSQDVHLRGLLPSLPGQ